MVPVGQPSKLITEIYKDH